LLALTFDDGPDPRETPAVLDALARASVTATFFVLGHKAEHHPDILRRVIDAGHDVQVHGYHHTDHTRTPRDEVEADLERVLEILDVKPRWWRPPNGNVAPFSHEVAEQHGLTLAGWTDDTRDWEHGRTAESMLAELRLEHGAIVLAHDGLGERSLQTARLIEPLVAKAKRAGLEPGPLRTPWPRTIPSGDPSSIS
jgi:peptidoglycan/xylan/chitin deacetylase (PgdA/CDA1 family)